VNADGFDELLIGDSLFDDDRGRAYVILGNRQLDTQSSGEVRLVDVGSRVPGVVLTGDATMESIGERVLSPGDVDGDGTPDVMILARGTDHPFRVRSVLLAGSELIASGQIDLATVGEDPDLLADPPARGVEIAGLVQQSLAPPSASPAGDLDSDGLADVIIGTRTFFQGDATLISGRRLREAMGPGERVQRLPVDEILGASRPDSRP